jgi:predicted nucleic-acid-binding Zn-ribbon protein
MSSLLQRSSIPPCPACGGQRVGAPCYEGALGYTSKMGIRHVSPLTALVCTNCGQTTLYAANMEALREELRKHPEGFTY